MQKYAFLSVIITFCAKPMGWFSRLGIFFSRIGEGTVPDILQFVFFLLAIPCFKASNLCFEIAYTLQHRKLVRLGRECVRLGGEDYSLQFDDRLVEFRKVSDRYERLRHILSKLQGRNCACNEGHIWHNVRAPGLSDINQDSERRAG